jgi:hypothetical protein
VSNPAPSIAEPQSQAPDASAAFESADASVADERCANAGFIVCDDFERATLAEGPFQLHQPDALSLDAARMHRGQRSLLIRAPNQRDAGGKLYLEGEQTLKLREGFFGRMHLYFVERTPKTHTDFVFAGDTNVVWRYGVEAHVFAGNWYGGGEGAFPADRFFTDRDLVPVDTWFCIEWQFDRQNAEMRLWLNGAQKPELTRSVSAPGDWPMPVFERIEIGWQMFGNDEGTQGFEFNIDDVALAHFRIGCL